MANDEEHDRAARKTTRTRWAAVGLTVAYLSAIVANSADGRGPIDGWLGYGVVLSLFLLLIAFGIRLLMWHRSANIVDFIDDLPDWVARPAAALAVVVLVVAVTVMVTP